MNTHTDFGKATSAQYCIITFTL